MAPFVIAALAFAVSPPPLAAGAGDVCPTAIQYLTGYDCSGNDISDSPAPTSEQCCDLCSQTAGCRAYTWAPTTWTGAGPATCYLKTACSKRKEDDSMSSAVFLPTPSSDSPRGSVTLFQSAKDSQDRLSQKDDLQFHDDFPTSLPVVDVGSRATDQAITGFGGAFTEAAAVVFQGMSEDHQNELLERYFDADKGIGYTVGRLHINSCDFSPSPAQWSEDDVAGDFDLAHFDSNLTHDSEAMIPFIKAGLRKVSEGGRELRLFASPWSPPAWMKTNGQMVGGGKLKSDSQEAWANYFVKWISAYKAKGIPLWAVTPQNEPENSAGWEACVYTAEEERDWVKGHLGPALQAAHPEVKIFPFDHNKDHVYEWANTFYSDAEAAQYIDGIAFHWYSGDLFENVARIHTEYPNVTLLPTEATWERYRWSPEATPETGDWSMGEGYGHDIMGDLNAGSVGWTDWNLLLDSTGGPNHLGNNCDAPMYANNSQNQLYVHPQYYYIGHFSKFLVPGSKRILSTVANSTTYQGGGRGYGTCGDDDGLEATAFERPDGRLAVVAMNCGGAPQPFKLKDGPRALLATVPAHGIQTYLFSRESSTAEAIIV